MSKSSHIQLLTITSLYNVNMLLAISFKVYSTHFMNKKSLIHSFNTMMSVEYPHQSRTLKTS